MIIPPCGRGVEYAHRFPVCRVRRLKEGSDGSVSTAWDYAGLPSPLNSLLHVVQHVPDWVAPFLAVRILLLHI